jgi:zinc/manganese transport system substrate-binding protein
MKSIVAVLALVSALALTGCSSSSGSSSGTSLGSGSTSTVVSAVAGENFWGDIIAQIGGEHVKVTSVISDPNADPHEYESSVKDAAAIARAKFVLLNGLGYDDFMQKLLSASPSSSREVLTAADIMSITGSDANPHIWYDTAKVPLVAHAITAQLSKLDPADAAQFAVNEQKFTSSLAPITATIAAIQAKYAGVKVAYTERVPGYLVDAAGLSLGVPAGFAQAIEDGNDPSPADTAAFDTAITAKTVRVLLYNGQVTDAQTDKAKSLATSAGVPIVGVTETLPSGDANFQAWQLRQAKELLAALGG